MMKLDFGEVMILLNIESTTLEDVSIDYEEKVATYNDCCDDTPK